MAAALTGSEIVQTTSSSVAVPFPATAVAGERLVVLTGSSFLADVAPPTGWTRLDRGGDAAWFSGYAITKIADAADITAGSVTVNFGGSEPVTGVCLSFSDADPLPIVEYARRQPNAGDTAEAVTVEPHAGDVGVYAAFTRGAASPAVDRGVTAESVSTTPACEVATEAGAASGTLNFTAGSNQGSYFIALYVRSSEDSLTDPLDLAPKLAVWCSADHEAANYADGATMTQWEDLSGNGNHLTAVGSPVWRATGGGDGGPHVDLTGGGYFILPSGIMTGATSGEGAFTAKPVGDGMWDFGIYANPPLYGAGVSDDFGSTVITDSYENIPLNVWQRYQVSSKADDWDNWADGVPIGTTNTNTVAWPTVPEFGRSGSGGQAINSPVGSFFLFTEALTAYERAALGKWLADNPGGGVVGGGGGTPQDIVLAETLPALVDTLVLESYTDTDTSNSVDAITIVGDSIEPDNNDPVVLPATAATQRDKALWYPTPDLVDGRPT